ncbi:hypothetical protein SANT12839_097830 [Streptomyces antimycoticus]|uniref:Uncharacterized protein n=1 Tax=Streptomyces antimycoticus TaxID=68175 RepID=A0A4D4KIB1_9ACTN|nr:hypothetical protein SANT12839_097830 [Streptomyces antimycoticus]
MDRVAPGRRRTIARMVDYPGPPPFAMMGALPPGRWDVRIDRFDTGVLSGRAGAEITGTDRSINMSSGWVRATVHDTVPVARPPSLAWSLVGHLSVYRGAPGRAAAPTR